MIVCSLRKYKDGIEYPHRKVISPWQIVRINIKSNQIRTEWCVCVCVCAYAFVCLWVEERDRERDNVFNVCLSIRLFLKERDRESLLMQRQGERERGHQAWLMLTLNLNVIPKCTPRIKDLIRSGRASSIIKLNQHLCSSSKGWGLRGLINNRL